MLRWKYAAAVMALAGIMAFETPCVVLAESVTPAASDGTTEGNQDSTVQSSSETVQQEDIFAKASAEETTDTTSDSTAAGTLAGTTEEVTETPTPTPTARPLKYERTIEDGTYVISSRLDNFMVLDVAGGSTKSGANVQLYEENGTDAQNFIVTWNEEGYYTIQNKKSGCYLDVNGSNVDQKSGITDSRKWYIVDSGEGYYEILSAVSEKAVDVKWAKSSNGTNIWIYGRNHTKAQQFRFTLSAERQNILHEQTIKNGTYVIGSGIDSLKVLDVAGGSTKSGANVQLYEANGTGAQKFIVTWNEEGYYTIQNKKSGCYLDVNGSNVDQKSGIADSRKWYIVDSGDGYYEILSAASKKAVDVKDGKSSNGNNIWIYRRNHTKAQRFRFFASAEKQTLSDGVYEISLASEQNQVLAVQDAGMKSGKSIVLAQKDDSDAQKFILTGTGSGKYRLTSLNSGMTVDLSGGNKKAGTRVQQYYNNGTAAQRWAIRCFGDGSFYILSSVSANLAVDAGSSSIVVKNTGSGDAQKFVFTKVSYTPVTGEYTIANSADTTKVLDISDGSRKVKANLQIYKSNNTNAQKFVIQDEGNGFITIKNVRSKHLLEVAGGSMKLRANVWQYKDTDRMEQNWIEHWNSDGTITFINAKSSFAMDVADGKTANKTNVRQYSWNGTKAQRFVLTETTGSDDADIDYSEAAGAETAAERKADQVLDQIGHNLDAAFRYSCMKWVKSPTDPSLGTEYYANLGMTNRKGNCYVMAGTFCLLAKRLGYDARQVSGVVPLRRGGLGPHSWVEINGRVYDPDFQVESGKNGFNIYYGKSGTWMYQKKSYMKLK